jgi:signal transduction histidine kinase
MTMARARSRRRWEPGFGLRGIRERAEQLKGRASYRMAPDEGFTLSVELPA